jgi:tetratricopeptide (TPR) repeat protein
MFDWRADWQAWARTHHLALDVARKIGNQHAEAVTLRSLGALNRELGRFDEATGMLTQAAEIFIRLDDRHRWAVAMRNLGDTLRYQGRLDEAIAAFSDALKIVEYEEARTLVRYGLVHRDRWNNDHALHMFEQALNTFRDLDDQRWQARALRHIAVVHRNEARPRAASGERPDSVGTGAADYPRVRGERIPTRPNRQTSGGSTRVRGERGSWIVRPARLLATSLRARGARAPQLVCMAGRMSLACAGLTESVADSRQPLWCNTYQRA